jgi:cupin fold WbuC family metalloprotein
MKLTKFFNNKNFKIDTSGKSPAVYVKNAIKINKKIVDELIKLSNLNGNINIRICMHKSKNCNIHNMIVLINKSQEYKKHSHPRSDEIYHLIKGKMKVLETKKNKTIKKTYLEKQGDVYVVGKRVEHIVLPISIYAIFHEIKLRQA